MFRLTFTALALALALACASTFARDALAEGFSPTAVSLPDGPGSVQGLGSGYEPSPGTGTVGFTVAVEVPPGSGGLAPELAFRYDSGGGDSFLGLGWALQGVPSVRVRTSDGLPRFDGRDVIELVGFGAPSALIAHGGGTDRPRVEGGAFECSCPTGVALDARRYRSRFGADPLNCVVDLPGFSLGMSMPNR